MEILEPDFENSVTAEIDKDTHKVIIASQKFDPVDFLRSDPTAYSEAFNNWFGKWVPNRLSVKEKILGFHPTNRARYDELCTLVKSHSIIPFVGAGMSIPTGMPPWISFLHELCSHTLRNHEEIDELFRSGKCEQAATLLFEHMPRALFDERVKNTYRLLRNQEIQGPVRFIPKIFPSTVITTNFDDILEVSYQNEGRRFDPILCGQEISGYREYRDTKKCLLKIHGDIIPGKPKVLTSAEYDRFYADNSAARCELELIFRTHHLLFLGCSLQHDRTMQILKKVSDEDPRSPSHYTFIPKPVEDATRIPLEHFLTERKIFPIWFEDDYNDSIEALFAGFLREMSII